MDVTIFIDSQAVLKSLMILKTASKRSDIYLLLQKLISLGESGISITLEWVPGHEGVLGSEFVDMLATSAS